MKGFLHDHSSSFGIRAAGADHPSHSATADPGQSPEACRQAQRAAEVSLSLSLLLFRKARRVAGSFFKVERLARAGPMDFLKNQHGLGFTRLHAHIVEEDGAFTVRVRMLNHLQQEQSAWGEEIVATFDLANSMIGSLASQFSIPQSGISIKIMMRRFNDGTLH